MNRSTTLLLSDFERLENWCHDVVEIVGRPVYLVGSALHRADYRDVDVRFVAPDGSYDRWLGGRPVKNRLVNRMFSTWGQRETGLPIDFQVQRESDANAAYGGARRNAMGIRDWSLIPPSGTPGGRSHE